LTLTLSVVLSPIRVWLYTNSGPAPLLSRPSTRSSIDYVVPRDVIFDRGIIFILWACPISYIYDTQMRIGFITYERRKGIRSPL
ncbi:hypothetical protein TSAR_002280, partial [Trichomalopsis sarcophagae]